MMQMRGRFIFPKILLRCWDGCPGIGGFDNHIYNGTGREGKSNILLYLDL